MSKNMWVRGALGMSLCMLVLLLFRRQGPELFLSAVTFPLVPLAEGLRWLSLKGGLFNVLAWLFYLDVACSPLYLLFLQRKKGFHLEDALLPLTSGFLFYALYGLINRSSFSLGGFGPSAHGFYGLYLGVTFYSLVISYGLLKFVRMLKEKDTLGLYEVARSALFVVFLFFIFQVLGPVLWQWLGTREAMVAENTALVGPLLKSEIFLFFGYVTKALPYVLTLPLLYQGAGLFQSMENKKSPKVLLEKADELRTHALRLLQGTLAVSVTYQLLQLIFIKELLRVESTLVLPLLPVALILSLYLLTVLLKENARLKEESDLFV